MTESVSSARNALLSKSPLERLCQGRSSCAVRSSYCCYNALVQLHNRFMNSLFFRYLGQCLSHPVCNILHCIYFIYSPVSTIITLLNNHTAIYIIVIKQRQSQQRSCI